MVRIVGIRAPNTEAPDSVYPGKINLRQDLFDDLFPYQESAVVGVTGIETGTSIETGVNNLDGDIMEPFTTNKESSVAF